MVGPALLRCKLTVAPFHWSHFLAVIGEGWCWRGRNNETTRVHVAARRRGRLAARGARAAAGDACDWIPQQRIAGWVCAFRHRVPPRPKGSGLRRGPERHDRVSLGRRTV